jgi:hypothetical protein
MELKLMGQEVKKAKCTVQLDNEIQSFTDFITIGFDQKGKVSVAHNCDILTISVGIEMMKYVMKEMYQVMPEDEKEIVNNYFREQEEFKNEQDRSKYTQ